jgi:hypothetical protein
MLNLVSRSRLWMNLVLVHWPTVSPPQRELQGVHDWDLFPEKLLLDEYPMMKQWQ